MIFNIMCCRKQYNSQNKKEVKALCEGSYFCWAPGLVPMLPTPKPDPREGCAKIIKFARKHLKKQNISNCQTRLVIRIWIRIRVFDRLVLLYQPLADCYHCFVAVFSHMYFLSHNLMLLFSCVILQLNNRHKYNNTH